MVKWFKRLIDQFNMYYPPPYTDEEFEKDREERTRRIVERYVGPYVTEEDIEKLKKDVLKIKL